MPWRSGRETWAHAPQVATGAPRGWGPGRVGIEPPTVPPCTGVLGPLCSTPRQEGGCDQDLRLFPGDQKVHASLFAYIGSHRLGPGRSMSSPTLVFPVPLRLGRCWPWPPLFLLVAQAGLDCPRLLAPSSCLRCSADTALIIGTVAFFPGEEGLAFCLGLSWLKGRQHQGFVCHLSQCAGARGP